MRQERNVSTTNLTGGDCSVCLLRRLSLLGTRKKKTIRHKNRLTDKKEECEKTMKPGTFFYLTNRL